MKFLFLCFLLTSYLFGQAPTFPIAPFSLTTNLRISGLYSTTNFQYAMDPMGNVVVIWLIFNGTNPVIQAAYKPFGSPWQLPGDPTIPRPNPPVPAQFGTLSDINSRVIAYNMMMDESGNTVVEWLIQSTINQGVIAVQTAYKPVGGNWQLPADPLSDNLAVNVLSVTVNALPDIYIAGGNVVLGWSINTGINGVPVAQAAYQPAASFVATNSKTYGAVDAGYNVATISDANAVSINAYPRVRPNGFLPALVINNTVPLLTVSTQTPQVAVDKAGNAVMAWQCSQNLLASPNSIAQGVYKPAAAANFNPSLVTSLSPTTIVGDNVVSAATSPAVQLFDYQGIPPPVVSPPPQVAIFLGNAVVVWAETDQVNNFLEAAYNKGGAGWQIPTQGI